jgi:3-deoxy-7-phosphoheptulonate synthase
VDTRRQTNIDGFLRMPADQQLEALPQVEAVVPILKPYKLASREFHPDPTIVRAAGVEIGGERITVIAGPCSVESEEQLLEARKR